MEIQSSEAESKFSLINTSMVNFVMNLIGGYEKHINELNAIIDRLSKETSIPKGVTQ